VAVLSRTEKVTTEGTILVRRVEITDQAWQKIEPLLHEYGQSGGQWRNHRTIINGILWKLRTGFTLARPV
jgi:transposase